MGKYLITGVSGTGKSTIARNLKALGLNAYDTDRVKGLSAWIERATGKPRSKDFNSADDWVEKYDWLWNERFLRQLLSTETEDIFLCGTSSNQENFYGLFNKVFLLEIDDLTLRDRLQNKDREHNFGKRPGELELILGWYKDFQERTKAMGAIIMDARQPVNIIIDHILAQINDN